MNSTIMTSSRRSTPLEILNILKMKGGATVDEMGTTLGVTTTAVRQHLTLLEKDGLISSRLLRKGMGRPCRLYGLTDRGDELFPKSYHALATDILDEIRLLDGEEKVNLILQSRAKRLATNMGYRLAGKDLRGRVEELTAILNEHGALAEFEESGDGFLIREHNCLLYKVAAQYPQVCDSEQWILKQVMDADVQSNKCIAKGDSICCHEVRARADAAE